ncbi:MAG: cytochrome c oxidase subunit II [Alphaproteobacteria bacterium]|nr:cytochrome c oxidase subunit II [Alphaproteobacteria bacterium]
MMFSQLIHKLTAVIALVFCLGVMSTHDAYAQVEPVNEGTPEEVTAPASPIEAATPDTMLVPADNSAVTEAMRAQPWQLGMRPAASPVQERIFEFHHYMLILITVVSVFVLALMIYVCVRFSEKANPNPSRVSHNTVIEVVWTILPVLILVAVSIPSLRHLYYMDKSEIEGKADLTIKIIGYQWYWNYEYPDAGIKFDSYMVQEADLKPGQPRLLTVDNPIYVPVGKKVRIQMTGGDVIHSWAMPNFGVKMDAVPGHLNETWFQADIEGTYYGQCSELCGVNHGFMPIMVHVVSQEVYDAWIEGAKEEFAADNSQYFPHYSTQQFAAIR